MRPSMEFLRSSDTASPKIENPARQILRFHKIGTQLQPNRHERRLIYYHGH
jgi:hypothetical protein